MILNYIFFQHVASAEKNRNATVRIKKYKFLSDVWITFYCVV